ncbi:MAG: pantoate--beta-alanine ligase [Chloroflexi bacterium RBG_19FT_COMBO_49_13]|nr:MAG: pantoate--beta-alanine ligase [Chloroflexi bacterium RBG_16_47_49]OGO61047.1 MAG: pantoate--beta-alanine ligase [Chloroflexi bacterium RBG_19FT_COMBO_49_13]
MDVVISLNELRLARNRLKEPVGLVPTMGFLHDGHLSLVKKARLDCTSVVVSIFVNPSQFGPHEDLNKYPRDLQRDVDLLRSADVDLVWTPTNEVMYPPGYQTWVTVEEASKPLEGAMRPEHFRGVATVVAKLFNAVQPQKAYFGQKDAQQAVVISQMGRDLDFPIEIVVCPTMREPDGLAMSSRNVYLSTEERQSVTVLSRALFRAKAVFETGERDVSQLRKVVLDTLATEPSVKVQYVSCAHPDTLQELEGQADRVLLSLAVSIGKTRLIDNIMI